MLVMTRRPFPLALALCVVMVGACTRSGAPGPAGTSPAPSNDAIVVATGAPIPGTTDELPVTDVEGFHTLLEAMHGTPVVVNAWASWCGPCTREAPILAAAAAKHRDVQFLGVDVKDSRGSAETWIADHGLNYPSLFDPPGAILTDLGAMGAPTTVVYAADGTVAATIPGELSQQALDEALAKVS